MLARLKKDKDCAAFGLQGIQDQPMAVAAKLLPQAKLIYADNQAVDPGLSGSWNSRKFKHPPPAMAKNGYMYGVMVVCNSLFPREKVCFKLILIVILKY